MLKFHPIELGAIDERRYESSKCLHPIEGSYRIALYRRTGRSRKANHAPYEEVITDENDWNQYLRKEGFNRKAEHTS